jgi:hypothetical protein
VRHLYSVFVVVLRAAGFLPGAAWVFGFAAGFGFSSAESAFAAAVRVAFFPIDSIWIRDSDARKPLWRR